MGEVYPSDRDLLSQAQDGDAVAFGRMIERHQDYIFNAVCHLVGNRDDAEDIAQEVFVKAWSALAGFQRKAKFSTWLYGIMLNTVRNYWRGSRRRKVVSMHPGDDEDRAPRAQIESEADTPIDTALRAEQIQAVRQAIGDLHEELREVIVLRDIQGFRYEEMAQMVGVPAGTVKSRLHRARLALKETLAPFYARSQQ